METLPQNLYLTECSAVKLTAQCGGEGIFFGASYLLCCTVQTSPVPEGHSDLFTLQLSFLKPLVQRGSQLHPGSYVLKLVVVGIVGFHNFSDRFQSNGIQEFIGSIKRQQTVR